LGTTRVPEPGEGVAGVSGGLLNSTVNIADLGKSAQDGFTDYQGFAGTTSPAGSAAWALRQ
jgi:hypothetical protein